MSEHETNIHFSSHRVRTPTPTMSTTPSNDPDFGEECLFKEDWDKANIALNRGDYDRLTVGCDYDMKVMRSLMTYDLENEDSFRFYLENSFKGWYEKVPKKRTSSPSYLGFCK